MICEFCILKIKNVSWHIELCLWDCSQFIPGIHNVFPGHVFSMHIPDKNVRAFPWKQDQVTKAWTEAVVEARTNHRLWNNQIKKGWELYPFIKNKGNYAIKSKVPDYYKETTFVGVKEDFLIPNVWKTWIIKKIFETSITILPMISVPSSIG